MQTVLLATMLACAAAMPVSPAAPSGVISAHLRGVKPMLNPKEIDSRGPRGHNFYAESCDQCGYRGKQCGCQYAVEYFACLTKHCAPANATSFAEKCGVVSEKCSTDIDVQCRGANTVCKSKLNQLPTGGLGFSLDIDEDNAYCGPHGKCIGKIGMKIHIQNGPKKEKKATKVAAPAPAAASPAPGPAVAAAPAKPAKEEEKIFLECGLPKKDGAELDDKKDWIICQEEVKDDVANCEVPMFKELMAGAAKKAYCVLKSKDGKKLTQNHWSAVINVHKKASTEKKAEEKKPAPAAAKKEKKAPAPKAEEPPLVMGDAHKLPWMVEKEKRAVAKKEEAAKKAEEPKKEEKKEAKTEEKPAKGAKSDSQLPWMSGKVNDKAPPPHQQVLN